MIVITDDCLECGSCVDECAQDAISEGEGKYVIDQDLCIECQSCMEVCPNDAIVEQ